MDPLTEIVRSALAGSRHGEWRADQQRLWSSAEPPGYRPRAQGWKLHLSATPLSAPLVLARAAKILEDEGCAFKFAASLDAVAELTATRVDRVLGGKVVTVYPDDDEVLLTLAARLHAATVGLPGPRVLSDRPYADGSLVHYRYGVFGGDLVLGNDGHWEARLVAPSGAVEPDQRRAWFAPPRWVSDPFAPAEPVADPTSPGPVLLDDRFLLHTAIRHAYRGGVYRATDTETGADVVVKHARPHVGGGLDGSDVRDLLRQEHAMLSRLAPSGICPRPVALVEEAEGLFLVQSQIAGPTLDQWVLRRYGDGRDPDPEPAVALCMQLVGIVGRLEAEGLLCRDFNPSNLIVDDTGEVRLVDLESLVAPGTVGVTMYTSGYAAPEQVASGWHGAAPDLAAARFGLGATAFFVATGVVPVLAADEPATRTVHGRIANWLAVLSRDNATARRLTPLVLGLTRDRPGERWTVEQAMSFLGGPDPDEVRPGTAARPGLVPVDILLQGGFDQLTATLNPAGRQLWPTPPELELYDPAAVQHGAGGVLAVLVQAARAPGHQDRTETVRSVSTWIRERSGPTSSRLPGLHFGASGTAWALLDAAAVLNSGRLRDTAVRLSREIALPSPNPDVCHGTAGAGLAQLHFWTELGDAEFAARAAVCADALVESVQPGRAGVIWPVPPDFDSALRGIRYYGYAHGVAGIGSFLLSAGRLLSRDDLVELAGRAGRTLVNAAIVADGAAWWGSGESADAAPAKLLHWCSGSAGVGTFLTELHRATGEAELAELAGLAARAVHRGRGASSTVQCHGIAGDGEFLLDLADATGESLYRGWARDLADQLSARACLREGRWVVPDESGTSVTAAYGNGLAGILSFLLRLRYGGRRIWTPDSDRTERHDRAGGQPALRALPEGSGPT